ncbi:lactosylceramide 1,3-N-acetyl-beta-D-glucosaminyltransferase-like isoform X3 [Varroa jacobsoni]|uniref:Hexosyltransferase n=1 Tax=Varroa destructor TaxID=109461 RepID=A0A7M7JL40_VARDE|nr:lactosylceramide 1,3-N-acetyl-beta-D-glucosaminyltransferase-like isoform X3 [Varroa destructor]XP_022689973.1 lactosylceramide 1,3-N-acetyl-beta-D-glucosaminyltransferase-like isoform X3 [Varroa jacobsoni]
MISFVRIENCPSLTFNLILFFWWIGLCILYFRQPPVPMPVKIQQYRIENYSDKERRLLQQQNCVRNARPCPRLQFNRTDDHLVDFPKFWYVLNTTPCSGKESLVVLVHSAPNHYAQRDSIRSTWGQGSQRLKKFWIKLVFLLAAVEDEAQNWKIQLEHLRYRDIVQVVISNDLGNFIDAYRNLTYKHVMGLKWAWENCPRAPWLLKMDDDIFVHLFNLYKMVKEDNREKLICYVQKQMPVTRDEGSKWRVTIPEYPLMFYEDYCSGWAYLMTPNIARRLYVESRYRPYFWVDDVHVTGTLAKMAGVPRVAINSKFTTVAESAIMWSNDDGNKEWKYIFGPTWGDPDLAAKAHSKAVDCQRRQCRCCFDIFTIHVEETRETLNSPRKGRAQVVTVN